MPALTPAQRRRQIELQRQRELAAKNANKPKRGQKGVPTSGGSKTKAGTIGGGKDSSPSDAELRRQGFEVGDGLPSGRQKPVQPPKPAPAKPKPKPSPGPTQTALEKRQPSSGGGGGGSSRPMPSAVTSGSSSSSNRPTPPASKPNVGPVADGESYARSKDPKKYNPLMQKTFGYQTGDAPDQRKASSTPANSGTNASDQTKENYSSSSIYDSKVKPPADMSKSKTTNQTSTAYSTGSLNKKSESLAEQIRKRRMGR